MPSRKRHASRKKSKIGSCCAGGVSGKGRKMPFGRPVVPDEKSRAAPRDSSGIGVSGNQANRYVEIDHPAAITRAIGDETAFDARTLRHRRECRFALRSRGDQDLRFAVVE